MMHFKSLRGFCLRILDRTASNSIDPRLNFFRTLKLRNWINSRSVVHSEQGSIIYIYKKKLEMGIKKNRRISWIVSRYSFQPVRNTIGIQLCRDSISALRAASNVSIPITILSFLNSQRKRRKGRRRGRNDPRTILSQFQQFYGDFDRSIPRTSHDKLKIDIFLFG